MTADFFLLDNTQFSVSHIEYSDPGQQELLLVTLESSLTGSWEIPVVNEPRFGFALHSGRGDVWGFGMVLGYKWGYAREHFHAYVWPSVYAWLGEEDEGLDPGV